MKASNDTTTKQKRLKKKAFIEPWCTGCGGAPVCVIFCKKHALTLVRDQKTYPFKRMTVDQTLCIGCGACATTGTLGIRLNGCPWDAITIKPCLSQ